MMSSAGMPISVAMIWAQVVSWPWPWLLEPTRAMPAPVGCRRISQESNIAMPRMSQFFDGPAPTISVKNETPRPMISRLSLRGLLFAQAGIVDRLHHLVHGAVIVAGIVFPAQRRVIRELLCLDKVL